MMDGTDLPPMHSNFARWYGAVDLRKDQSHRRARWDGVVGVARSAGRDDVEALIRLAFRTRQPAASAAVQTIRQAFKAADDAFDMQGNDRELQVLAGACLVVLMDYDKDIAGAAALAVTTAALGCDRRLDLPMDLLALAESAIDRIAEADRQRPALEDYSSLKPLKLDFKEAKRKVRGEQTWGALAGAFALAAKDVTAALAAAAERQVKAARAVSRFFRIQDEEMQMLWWLTGQRSWDYDCPFSDVPVLAQPLAFAKELADSTEFPPGPPSVMGLLSRAGLDELTSVKIPAVINAANQEWLEQVVGEEDPSAVSAPLHFAVKRRLETGAGDEWVPAWAAMTEASADQTVSPLRLGVQFYRERLLRKLN